MDKDLQDFDSNQDAASNNFIFSRPSPIPSPERSSNTGNHSGNIFGGNSTQDYSFAAPAFVEKEDFSDERITSTENIVSIKPKKLLHLEKMLKSKLLKAKLNSSKDSNKSKPPKSPLYAHDIKKTDTFAELERNTRRNKDIKLEISKSITCAEVPDVLLDKSVANKYFGKFGEILKLIVRPKKKIITVYFKNIKAADEAFNKANSYMGYKFKTAYTTSDMLLKQKKVESPKKNITSFFNVDDEVKEELEAMRGLEYNLPDSGSLKNLNTIAKAKVKKAKEVVANREVPKRISKPLIRPGKSIDLEKKVKPLIRPGTSIDPEKKVKPLIRPGKSIDLEKKITPQIEKPKADLKVPKISVAMIDELQSQIRQPAMTSEEKYKVLEARDRLMRLKQSKQQNLATAKVKKGTCLDMCPEKERYMREFQRTLSSYEQMESNDYKINHGIAIKQYSRSSADQEEPMAHDLRPVKSLKMTMSYLLHEICDLCEDDNTNLTEWYHFLWDRMRSIRKDITHQELCCPETVELVEQCARFHIVASERLCAEEISVFDSKINSENLTKCLQTLKYMYCDLREHGISCKNEPEFQAYVILLNLNNGSFITDLRTLPPLVQQSHEIKFALNVYSSMAMDNYSRFFKLVRCTTYLNACILLRYFNQVREKALSIMIKAYCRATGVTEYPLYELVDILGFEDPDELLCFCSKVGLKCDNDELNIKLSKENFHTPKSNIEQMRALNVVLSKRLLKNEKVGQCIAGGSLPERTYERHRPHCSFDSKGYLLLSSYDAKDQSLSDPYQFTDDDVLLVPESKETRTIMKFNNNIEQKGPVGSSFKPFQQKSDILSNTSSFPKTENSIFKNVNSNIFNSTVNNTTSIFAKPQTPAISTISTQFTSLPTNSPTNTTVNKSIFSQSNCQTNLFKMQSESNDSRPDINVFSSDRINLKRRLENTEGIAEKKTLTESENELKKKLEAEEKQRAVEKQKAEEKKIAEDKVKLEQEKLVRLKKINEFSEIEYQYILKEVTDEESALIMRSEINRINMINTLSEKIYKTMLDGILKNILDEQLFIQDMLIEVDRRYQDKLVLKYYRIWKLWASRRRVQRREALDNTPVWLQPESLQDRAKKLYNPQQKIAINYARDIRRRSQELDKKENKSKRTGVEFIITVGLKENTKSFDVEPSYEHTFWKLGISWPLLENNLTLWRHKNLINKYLNADMLETVLIQHRPSPQERLDICIRQFEGLLSENCLTGADGLLFIASVNEETRFLERRLTKSVLSREKLMPIPVVILVFGDNFSDPTVIKPSSIIENLLESGHVSEYSILYERSTDEEVVLKVIQTAILWLAINRSPMIPLEMNYLKSVFDDCITEELWLRIRSTLSDKPQFSTALCDANFVIDLHNQAVNYVMDIILDVESMSYTDFAPELKIFLNAKRSYPCTYEYFDNVWKHPEYRAELERIINSFVFPPWRDNWPILDTLELNDALLRYCRQILSDEDSISITDDIMADLFLILGPNENQCPSFTDVVIQIMRRKICDIAGNTRVVYNKNHIKHFQTLPWWFKSPILMNYAVEHKIEESKSFKNETFSEKQLNASTLPMGENLEPISIDELNETYEQLDTDIPIKELCKDLSTCVSSVKSVTDELDKQMEEYKKWNQDFEAKLKASIEEGDFTFDR